jgi:hypothetical protein
MAEAPVFGVPSSLGSISVMIVGVKYEKVMSNVPVPVEVEL